MERNIQAGEKEVIEGYKETIFRNVTAAVAHGNETRKMFRDLEEKVKNLENLILSKDKVVEDLKKQMVFLQQILARGGTH